MGCWDNCYRSFVRIRVTDPKHLVRILARVIKPHPVFPSPKVTFPAEWGNVPWSGVVRSGKVILDNVISSLPVCEVRDLELLNEASKVAHDRECAEIFGPYEPYTMDDRFVIGHSDDHHDSIDSLTISLDDVSDELVRNNIFLYTCLILGVDQKRGGVVDGGNGEYFSIHVTSYELGGNELMYTINTIYQACQYVCLGDDHALATLRQLDGVESIQIVGEDGRGGVYLNLGVTLGEYYGLGTFADSDYESGEDVSGDTKHDSDSESGEDVDGGSEHDSDSESTNLENYDSRWFGWINDQEEDEDGDCALENFVMGLTLKERYHEPEMGLIFVPHRLPLIYYIMGHWQLWVKAAAFRMKVTRAVRVIQRWARSCLYNPVYKKGRAHAMRLFEELAQPEVPEVRKSKRLCL